MTIFKFTEARVRDLELGSGIHRDTDVKGLLCICHKTTKTFAVQGDVRRQKRHIRTVRMKIGRTDLVRLGEARNKARKLMATIQSGIDPTAGPEATGMTLEQALAKRRKRGKSPLDRNWMKRPYNSRDQIKHMEPGSNVGVRLRPFELVLDVDPRAFPDGQTLESPINPFVELVLWTGINPDLYSTVETGSGGLHIYMTKSEDVSTRDSLNDQFPGIEFKTAGRQVVAPRSVHPDSQKTYTWKADTPELDAFVAEAAPKALVDLIRRPSGSVAAGGGEYSDRGTLIGIRWDSLHADNDGNRITFRTLHKLLRDAGAEDAIPRPPAADDFDDDLDDASTNALATSKRRPVHEGGLAVNNNTGIAPDTAKNALKAINGSKLDPRFDELKQRVVLMGELPWGEGYGRVLTDKPLLLARTWLMEQHQRKDYQSFKRNVQDTITTVAYFYKFNPILDYLDSLTWDGTSRVKDLFTDAFQCARDDYTEGVWVHEFAELAGLRASDMDVPKAFMSRATDRYRTPYGCNTEDHQRRVVFAGTVNEGG